ncbi:divalent-cation tolerance protein CutA [Maricaulaceae bacterium EIL42A08]|nr:divalent-cation tolerance protein CutA [Maricaulaceae bacterium EIL42A08]
MTKAHSAMGLVYTTWPDRASVEAAARILLDERLIACANILRASTSIYRWQDQVETAEEIIALFKTSTRKLEALRERISELHPYDEPAIISLNVDADGSSAAFLAWVDEECAP